MSELPKGWVEARLDDFCAFENGDRGKNYSGRSTFVASGIPFISAGHLNNGHIDWEEMNYIPQTNYDRLGSGKVRSGDFLFCLRGSLGKHAFVPRIDAAAIASSLVIIRPSQLTDCKFVDYYFRSPLVKSSIEIYSNGVAQPNLSSANLGRFGFPLPPLAEQKRIVAKLDALNAKSARARTELARIETLVSRYKQAVLSKAFSGIEAERASLLDLTEFVTSGSRGWAKFYSDTGPLFIRIGNTVRGTIVPDLYEIQRVNPPEGAEGIRTRVQPSDIVVTITADLGRIALIDEQIGEAYVNQHLALVRLLAPDSAAFFAWYLVSDEGQAQLHQNNRGATRSGLGLDDIRKVEVPTPPLEEQHEIVRRIESAFAKIDRLAKEAKRALELVGRLDEAILAKAFRGELVPQDENDEPAEHLLARIRAGREAAPKGKRGRKATI